MQQEVLVAEVMRDIRDAPPVGFVLPFLVGTPGEWHVLGIFPAPMARGYRARMREGLQELGLQDAVVFRVYRVAQYIRSNRTWLLVGDDGRPLAILSGRPTAVAANTRLYHMKIGDLRFDGHPPYAHDSDSYLH